MDKSVSKLFQRLSTVSKLEFSSRCRNIPPSYPNRVGRGNVVIQSQDDTSITFFEKGMWQGVQTDRKVSFTNVFRWKKSQEGGVFSLEHLRFGESNPIHLFDLIQVEQNLFQSIKPHECKEDIYRGSVLFDDHFIELNWRIVGPKKNEMITLVYM